MDFQREYHAGNPWSYGSQASVKKYLRSKRSGKRLNVARLLSTLDIYTKYKPFRRPRTYNPVYVRRARDLWQADCIYFSHPDLVAANHEFKYCLVIIDCGSKFAWCYPLRDTKSNSEVLAAFKKVLKICGKPPARLQTDRGSEFRCKQLAKLLAQHRIHHYYSYSDNKACIAERFNLTLQTLLYKIMEFFNSYRWSKFLPLALKIYHNRYHRSIKMTPNQAELPASQDRLSQVHSQRYNKIKRVKAKFRVGDTVRIAAARTKFTRGYKQNYTNGLYRIHRVLVNQPIPRYVVQDLADGTIITGNFGQHEITSYNPHLSPIQI